MFRTDPAPAKAVEVAAMLGDSVVGVKHCMDPRSGRLTRTTRVLAAGGLACLLASAAAFYVSVDTAADNAAAREHHTRALHKPAYSFRPREVGAPVSALAFGGLALGLLASVTALVRARSERRSPFYRIGTAPGVEQPVEGAPSESFPLVAPSGDDFVLNYGAGIEGELIVDGRSTTLAELAATGRARPSATAVGAVEIAIPAAAKIRARAGRATFLVSAVARPARQTSPLFAMLEGRPLKYAAGSLVAHLALVLVLSQLPEEAAVPSPPMGSREELSVIAKLEAHEPPPPIVSEEPVDPSPGTDSPARTGMKLPGRADEAPPKRADEPRPLSGNADGEASMTREEALELARSAGPVGSTRLRDTIAALTSDVDVDGGFDGTGFIGGRDGLDGAGGNPFGGGRSAGVCFTGPCDIVRTGGYITRGGKLGPYGPGGAGGAFLRDRVAAAPRIPLPTEVSGGGLDKATIKRHVKRNEASIGYCYEKELLARPGLAGSVSIRFLIAGDGTVQQATGDGFDPAVTSCVAKVIQSIHFPATGDGSSVSVNYPFTFRAAGQ